MASQIGYLKVDIAIKFRALGFTFGNWKDTAVVPLPPMLQLVESLVHAHQIFAYNQHGVNVVLTLQETPIG